MKDLDFDELDRAVSSLMNEKKPDNKPMPDEQDQDSVSSTSSPDTQAPSPKEETVSEDQANPLTPSPKIDSQIQKRSSGMYMDMMPIKQQTKTTTLQGHGETALLSPLNDNPASTKQEPPKTPAPFHDILPPKANSNSSTPAPSVDPDLLSPQTPAAEDTEVQDQLEAALREQSDYSSSQSLPETSLGTTLSPTSSDSLPDAVEDSSPKDLPESALPTEAPETKPEEPAGTVSPFLADAKVEKRPLGGVSPDEQTKEQPEVAPTQQDADKNNNSLMPSKDASTLPLDGLQNENNQQAVPAPLPPEFHEDLLAVEADRHKKTNPEKVAETPETIAQVSAAHVGPLSITQQYKEKMSTGDQSHTPIYDTNVQPLSHPAHKKSGWGVVVGIVALTLLCVVVAAVLYFTGIL